MSLQKISQTIFALAGMCLFTACDGDKSASSSSGAVTTKPSVTWILPTANANAGLGSQTALTIAVAIEGKGAKIKSARVGATALTLSADGLWVGTLMVPAQGGKITLVVQDEKGHESTFEHSVKNTLYGAYPRAVEFDKQNERLLFTGFSSEKLLAMDLKTKSLKEVPISDVSIKNRMGGYLAYSSVSQLAYIPNFTSEGSIGALNTQTGEVSLVANSEGDYAPSLCVNPVSQDLYTISYGGPLGGGSGAYLRRFGAQGVTDYSFDPIQLINAWSLGVITCAGDGSLTAVNYTNSVTTINPNSLQITPLNFSSITPNLPNGQLRFKHYGTGSGYLLVLVGDDTAIYKADSITATPQLITGSNSATGEKRGAGNPIVWAWDATIDEEGKRIYTRDSTGVISVDITTGNRTQIFAESISQGDLTGAVGVSLSDDRQYAYSFTLWNANLRMTNLQTGKIDIIRFKNGDLNEEYNFSFHHTMAAKFSKSKNLVYQLGQRALSIYDMTGALVKRIEGVPAGAGGFELDEAIDTAYLVGNDNNGPKVLSAVSLQDGSSIPLGSFTGLKDIIGISKISDSIYYLVDQEGALAEFNATEQRLTLIGSLANAVFDKDHYIFQTKGHSVSVVDKAKNKLYVTYGPNLAEVDLANKAMRPVNLTGGTQLADISGLTLDPKYNILWATDSVLNSIVAIRDGTVLTVVR